MCFPAGFIATTQQQQQHRDPVHTISHFVIVRISALATRIPARTSRNLFPVLTLNALHLHDKSLPLHLLHDAVNMLCLSGTWYNY